MRSASNAVLVAALLAGLGGCSKSVAVSVNLVTVGCVGSPDPFNADGGGGLPSVQYLAFNVSVDGGSVFTETTAIGSQTLQVPQVALGTLNINVQGLSSATGGDGTARSSRLVAREREVVLMLLGCSTFYAQEDSVLCRPCRR